MKKILCVGLVVSFGVILSLGFSKKSYAKIDHNFSFSDGGNTGGGGGSQQYITVSPNNSILDMGKGIDLSYSGLDHIKSSVFSDDYAKKLVDYAASHSIESSKKHHYVTSSLEIGEIYNTINKNFKEDLNINYNSNDEETIKINGLINVSGSQCLYKEKNNKSSNFYYYDTLVQESYKTSISKDYFLPETIEANSGYSISFLKDLNEMKQNTYSFDYYDFFETYGTHLLSSAIFGGSVEAFVHIFNKNYAFSENYKNDITENASMLIKLDDINSNLNVNVSNQNAILMNSKYSYLNSDCSIKVNEIGLVERNDTVSNSDYSFSYSNWNDLLKKSNYGNSGLISLGNDKIYGIWEIVPNSMSSLKKIIKEKCLSYFQREISNNDKYDSLSSGKLQFSLIRNESIIVTDDYVCNNHYDYVYLPYLDGFVGKNEYINKGYKKC